MTDDIVKYIVAPLVGVIVWIIQNGMSKNTKALEELSAAIRRLVNQHEVNQVRAENEARATRDQVSQLANHVKDATSFCRLSSAVAADRVERAAEHTLKECNKS